MATTTDDQLEQILRRLPPRYSASSELLAGGASQLALVLNVGEGDFRASGFFENAEAVWLDLHARGYGLIRASGESDAQLRERLRNVGESVTVSAILDGVNALLAPLTAVPAELFEHWDEPLVLDTDSLDFAAIADNSYLRDQKNAFTLVVPDFGDLTLPIYAAISSEVERLRAAGVRWYLLVSGAP